MKRNWSEEISFEEKAIHNQVPRKPGVYRFLQSEEYCRYKGHTRVLKIGKSEKDLCEEILNHFRRHTAANRLFRIRKRAGTQVTVDYIDDLRGNASKLEQSLLQEFEDEYWDLPILNSQRGYARGQDKHYKE